MNEFSIKVITPTNKYTLSNIQKCSFSTEFGKTCILSRHADYVSSFIASNIVLQKKNLKEIYKAYRGVVYFKNITNELYFVCAGFDKDFIKVTKIKKEKIDKILSTKDYSKFTIKYLQEEKGALEVLESL